MAEVDLPYKVEYAKSNRAMCKSCSSNIAKDSLRLATVVQSRRFDGKTTNWYHYRCFFIKNKPKSTGDIDGFSNIKYDDQKKIEEKVGSGGGTAELATKKNVTAKEKKEATKEYSVERAKSGRATCRSCELLIAKDQVRISKMEYDSERARAYGPYPGWYHVDCFVANRERLEWYLPAADLPGFKSLSVDDQKSLKEKLTKVAPVKRTADENDNDVEQSVAKKSKAEEAVLKKQSDQLFDLQNKLESELTKRQLTEIFEYNDLHIPSGISRLVQWLADAIVFGVCDPCPQCGSKALRFKNNEYRCYGDFSEFTSCTYSTAEPKRKKIKIPKEFLAEFPFLKGSVGKRAISSTAAKPTVRPQAEVKSEGIQKVLVDCNIVIESSAQPEEVVRAKILSFGGKVVKAVNSKVLCVISTQENVDKMTTKIKKAKKDNVFVVSEDFLDKCRQGSVELVKHKLTDWGDETNVAGQLANAAKSAAALPSKSGKSIFTKSGETKVKVKANGIAVVEPESGLDGIATVYHRGKDVYSCVLGLADVTRGTNSFYKIQLLESRGTYFVFRSWGRIGTTIGGNKLEQHGSLQDAIIDFKAVFVDKTGNDWENRKNFEKKPKHFDIIDMDLLQSEEHIDRKEALKATSKSKLALPIQELLCLIFDINVMNRQMKEFEIDLQKMPLGKISKEQITKAYKILTELQGLIDTKASRLQFLDASNRFFTVIPHDFGMNAPPLLDNPDIIKEKVEMLDSLGEMELTMKMLKEENTDDLLPVDHHYAQLKTDVEVLPRDSETFGLLQKYVKTTHAETHSGYDLEILDVFTIARHGEAQRFKPFKRLHNHKLLWHGSRLSNFAGILSQGLRIAPPEAPVTGYMFGKGVYFADMVSKSANYCCTGPTNPIGILLLCDVALGDMYELTHSEYVTQLPDRKHSTKGVGQTQPANEDKLDNIVVPLGPAKKTKTNSSLLYNEYIVYDTAQIQIRYLLKVNFKYKY